MHTWWCRYQGRSLRHGHGISGCLLGRAGLAQACPPWRCATARCAAHVCRQPPGPTSCAGSPVLQGTPGPNVKPCEGLVSLAAGTAGFVGLTSRWCSAWSRSAHIGTHAVKLCCSKLTQSSCVRRQPLSRPGALLLQPPLCSILLRPAASQRKSYRLAMVVVARRETC